MEERANMNPKGPQGHEETTLKQPAKRKSGLAGAKARVENNNSRGPQSDRQEGRCGEVGPMYSAMEIADEILKIGKRAGMSFTPMQLMKLVYIAHGWSLAVLDRDIFQDRIEAWKYGPVIPALYQATRQFRRKPIPHHLIDEDSPPKVCDEVLSFLHDVVDKYGYLNGIQLSNLTHLPGTPWDQVYEPDGSNIEISDRLIKQYYSEKLDEYGKNSTAAQ